MSEREAALARRLLGQSVGVITGAVAIIILSVTLQHEQGIETFSWLWWCVAVGSVMWARGAYVAWKDYRYAREVLREWSRGWVSR